MMNDIIVDKKLNCSSIMVSMKISDYLSIVDEVYAQKGGIQGQRDALKQKTAITIRNRMINDITQGAILPPVVIGVILSESEYNKVENDIDYNIMEIIKSIDTDSISIIDGMQRTTAIKKALDNNKDIIDNTIRVEFWVSKNVNSLIYRMLVLNTGQVPWNIRRQIEIIFGSVINTIKEKVSNISIIAVDDQKRRKKGGEYNANDLIEMFLAFGARTWRIDTKEKLTDEFTRGDFVQSSSETDIVDSFCNVLSLMSDFDTLLDNKIGKEQHSEGKFSIGRDLFSSAPAKIGFASACGIAILGRPGIDREESEIVSKTESVKRAVKSILKKIGETDDVVQFVDFETLSAMTEKKSSKIGDYERELFFSAFKTMIEENGEIDSLTVCWRSV